MLAEPGFGSIGGNSYLISFCGHLGLHFNAFIIADGHRAIIRGRARRYFVPLDRAGRRFDALSPFSG